jgi:hypothetical protein
MPMASADPRPESGRRAAWKDRARDLAHAALAPVVSLLASLGLRADHLTVGGLLFSLGSAFAFYDGHSRLAR